MAKRFTDSDKWKRPFFNKLSNEAKLAWFYLLDNCDSSGVWHCDYGLMSYQLNFEASKEDLIRWFGDKVFFMDEDKIFIQSFVEFQYGELNPANNAHKPVIKIAQKISKIKPLKSPLLGAQDKDKDKDKDKEEKNSFSFISQLELVYKEYPNKEGKSIGLKKISKEIKSENDFLLFKKAVQNYALKVRTEKTEKKFIKHFSTFCNEVWRDYIDIEQEKTSKQNTAEVIARMIREGQGGAS